MKTRQKFILTGMVEGYRAKIVFFSRTSFVLISHSTKYDSFEMRVIFGYSLFFKKGSLHVRIEFVSFTKKSDIRKKIVFHIYTCYNYKCYKNNIF